MGRYVPLALRKKTDNPSTMDMNEARPEVADTAVSDDTPRSLASLSISEEPKPSGSTKYAINEIHDHYRPPAALEDPAVEFTPCPPSSLNNSLDQPDGLAYIMLFPDANPKWQSEKLIYAKSNLELLPGLEGLAMRGWTDGGGLRKFRGGKHAERGEHWSAGRKGGEDGKRDEDHIADHGKVPAEGEAGAPTIDTQQSLAAESAVDNDAPLPAPPLVDYASDDDMPSNISSVSSINNDIVTSRLIPVFEQKRRGRRTTEFLGYYHIQKILYLRPHSRALINMLEIKFGGDKPATPAATEGEKKIDEAAKTYDQVTQTVPSTSEQETVKLTAPPEATNPTNAPRFNRQSEDASTKARRNSKAKEPSDPAQRSSEAWDRSLSVPWAVVKMKLAALPRPQPGEQSSESQGTEANKDEDSFWTSEEGLDPPEIKTYPEKDGDYYKEQRDGYKQRRDWREQRGRGRGRGGRGGGRRRGRGGGELRGGWSGQKTRLDEGGEMNPAEGGANSPQEGGSGGARFGARDVRLDEGTASAAFTSPAQTGTAAAAKENEPPAHAAAEPDKGDEREQT